MDISSPIVFLSEHMPECSPNEPQLATCHNLLPVQGSDTQWYRNVLKNPSVRIDARGLGAECRATPVTDAKSAKSVIERFREKYWAEDVKKYYSTFDAAVAVQLTRVGMPANVDLPLAPA